jgi:hypothetical protein
VLGISSSNDYILLWDGVGNFGDEGESESTAFEIGIGLVHPCPSGNKIIYFGFDNSVFEFRNWRSQ